MRNEMTNRQAYYAIASFLCYVVSCYIAFSETWTTGVMKIFMAVIVTSAALFVYYCGRLADTPSQPQPSEHPVAPVPSYSAAK